MMSGKKRFLWRVLFAGLVCCIIICVLCAAQKPEKESLQITVLDVGKGDCILISKDGSHVLIDAGYAGTSKDVISYLREEKIERLDYFIITHYDKDHVGGAAAIAEQFPIGRICLPNYDGKSKQYTALMNVIAGKSLDAYRVSEDVSFTLADVKYDIIASDVAYIPGDEDSEGNDNDVSLVIAAYWNKDSYLFAGDLEKVGIRSFLSSGMGSFDVVKMPHHGQNESNTDDFVESVQPKIALITDSAEYPADDKVLKMLKDADADVFCSSECGRIVLTGTGTGNYTVTAENSD